MNIEIIIPSYNCTKTLHRALSSLDAQTNADFSVHVIDDCSTEDLLPILEMHSALNMRVTRNPYNIGCGMTRQVGIDNTKADYFAFVDSDDVLMPYAVEIWHNMATTSPNADFFHSYFIEQTMVNGNPVLVTHQKEISFCHGKLYKTSFIRNTGIKNSPEVKWADDSFFNTMCFEMGRCSEIKIPMYMWLNNPESVTRSGSKDFAGDFIHAFLLAMRFVKSKGAKEMKYIELGLKTIEENMYRVDEVAKQEYETLLKEFHSA